MTVTETYWEESYPPEVFTGGVVQPAPTITTIAPTSMSAAAGASTITVTGTGYLVGSQVRIDGAPKTTTHVSGTVLTIAYDPEVAGTVSITVRNPDGKVSNGRFLTVGALGDDPEPQSDEPEPEEYPTEEEETEDESPS